MGAGTQLQFFAMEEGRIRPITLANGSSSYAFDYMLKDHLGNVRTVLTDEQKTDRYPVATLESAGNAVSKEKDYYDIVDAYVVDKPTGTSPSHLLDYINDNGTNNPNTFGDKNAVSQKMYRLNAATNRTGLSRLLKVMAGDKINILAKSYYRYSGGAVTNTPFDATDLISSLLGTVGGNVATSHGATPALLNSDPSLALPLKTFSDNNPVNGGNNVKAALNYIILDEHFKFVTGNFDPVNTASDGGLKPHFIQDIQIPKNGYIYIYCSNESNIDVFFDNMEVVHQRGPLLEETHYYPFGLTMAGISSKALAFGGSENRYKFNDGTERTTDLDLNWDETTFRSYDPQIGRFLQTDPLSHFNESWSPYSFAQDNPIFFNDPLGLAADSTPKAPVAANLVNPDEAIVTACSPCTGPYSPSINTFAIALPLATSITFGEVISTIGAGLATAAEVTVASAAATVLAVGGAAIYIQNTYFPPGAIRYLPRGINGGSDNTLARRPGVLPIAAPGTGYGPLPFVIPGTLNNNGTPTKVYQLGGWDISTMKWVVLKYGVASTAYDTYGGLFNRRPDSQLSGKLGEALRSDPRIPATLLVQRPITMGVFPDKTTAHAAEASLVLIYMATHNGQRPLLQERP